MSNTYFQFKQFKIDQNKSAMKVCTDSCLFGAWVADKIEKKRINAKTILDIGSGTGLLSLMLAQKSHAIIYAIEIDKNSFEQTKANFISSKWQQQLNVYHSDIKEWKHDLKYDLIISNPPFFENDLISEANSKNIAKHHAGLSLKELMQSIKSNLVTDGNFAVLLPYHRIKYFIDVAVENNFYPEEEMLVKQTQEHNYFRGMLLFGTKKMMPTYNEMGIKNKNGNYSSQFQNLLKDYYLE